MGGGREGGRFMTGIEMKKHVNACVQFPFLLFCSFPSSTRQIPLDFHWACCGLVEIGDAELQGFDPPSSYLF